MKRLTIFLAALFCMLQPNADAQVRTKGYHGSNSFIDQNLLYVGLETVHGYMFNEFFYLGAGVSISSTPLLMPLSDFELFLQGTAFVKHGRHSPLIGVKVSRVLEGEEYRMLYMSKYAVNFDLGWYFETRSGRGMSASLGIPIRVTDLNFGPNAFYPSLKYSFWF